MSKKQEENNTIMTKEGFDKMKAELEERKSKIRTEIANKLETATEQGDLSENAAYKSALEEKELNESKIQELEEILADAVIQDSKKSKSGVANIGSKVEVERQDTKDMIKFTLVGKSESDPANQMISIESPIGKAVYKHEKGDSVEAKLPTGSITLVIKKVS